MNQIEVFPNLHCRLNIVTIIPQLMVNKADQKLQKTNKKEKEIITLTEREKHPGLVSLGLTR